MGHLNWLRDSLAGPSACNKRLPFEPDPPGPPTKPQPTGGRLIYSDSDPGPAYRLRKCPTHGQQPPNAWGCPECVRELRGELATAREALRRLSQWGGRPFARGLDAEVAFDVENWILSGMTGPLPPLPDHITKRDQPTTEDQP